MKRKGIIIAASIGCLLLVGGLLYFLLSKPTITISFDSNGGTPVNSMKIEKGGKINIPLSTKDGSTLLGWFKDSEKITNETTFSEDTTLVAKWEEALKTFTITFDSKGGSNVDKMIIPCDTELPNLPTSTKNGYVFQAWEDINGRAILEKALLTCEDLTLYARWEKKEEKKTFTVKFDTNGGSSVATQTITEGNKVKKPNNPTKNGFTFAGWYNGEKEYDFNTIVKSNLTIRAAWKENAKEVTKTYTVTFNTDGGSSVSTQTIESGKTATKPTNPTKSGSTFTEWQLNGKTYKFNEPVVANITLVAIWEKEKTYTCPSGYTLSGTKCTIQGTVHETCPEGTKIDGTLCIKTTDSNGGTRQCKEDTVSTDGKGHTWTGKGDYHFNGAYGKCAYYKWTNYTTKTQCDNASDINHRTVWVSDLNGCYAEDKMNNYETVCTGDYKYYSSTELSSKFGIHDNGKCLRKVDKVKYCDSDYTLTNGKCIKTIDATLK